MNTSLTKLLPFDLYTEVISLISVPRILGAFPDSNNGNERPISSVYGQYIGPVVSIQDASTESTSWIRSDRELEHYPCYASPKQYCTCLTHGGVLGDLLRLLFVTDDATYSCDVQENLSEV
jgi:hypothetical protein